MLDRPHLIARLPELWGKTVACWCRRSDEPWTADNVCHADVLDLWLRCFSDETLAWLGEHEMPVEGMGELEARLEDLLRVPWSTALAAGGTG